MASITIRNLEDSLKARLRVRAAKNGRSMEEEARQILKAGLRAKPSRSEDLHEAIRRYIEPLGGIELTPLPREPMRTPPEFGDDHS